MDQGTCPSIRARSRAMATEWTRTRTCLSPLTGSHKAKDEERERYLEETEKRDRAILNNEDTSIKQNSRPLPTSHSVYEELERSPLNMARNNTCTSARGFTQQVNDSLVQFDRPQHQWQTDKSRVRPPGRAQTPQTNRNYSLHMKTMCPSSLRYDRRRQHQHTNTRRKDVRRCTRHRSPTSWTRRRMTNHTTYLSVTVRNGLHDPIPTDAWTRIASTPHVHWSANHCHRTSRK